MIRVTNPRGVISTYRYDDLGRQFEEMRAAEYTPSAAMPGFIHEAPRTTKFYDLVDRITDIKNPIGTITAYQYDTLDRKTKITEGLVSYIPDGVPEQRFTTAKYDAADQVIEVTRGDSPSNTILAEDGRGFPYRNILSIKYVYDALNRRRQELPLFNLNWDIAKNDYGHTQPYSKTDYDAQGRVTQVTTRAVCIQS